MGEEDVIEAGELETLALEFLLCPFSAIDHKEIVSEIHDCAGWIMHW